MRIQSIPILFLLSILPPLVFAQQETADETKTRADTRFMRDDYVKAIDNNFTTINDGEYVRVTFEKELDSTKDITIYARSDESASIEVYQKDSDTMLAIFTDIQDYKKWVRALSAFRS